MAEQPVVIQKISWESLCPWTIIFRTLPVASTLSVIALSLVGVVVAPIGWRTAEALFVNEDLRNDTQMTEIIRNNNSPYRGVLLPIADGVEPLTVMGVRVTGPREVFRQFVNPYRSLFNRDYSLRKFGYFLFGALWMLALWSFVGVAICRICLMRLTRNEFLGMDDAFEYALEKWTTAIGAIGAPLTAILVICLPLSIVGLLMGFDVGLMLVGLLWVIVIAAAALMGVLLFGLMFGWPLMVASVSCEGQNAFDAMTRSYAYVFQRPLHYLFYSLVAILFGGLCWIIVAALADMVVNLSYWSTSWGANVSIDRMTEIVEAPPLDADGVSTETQTHYIGRSAIGLWNGLIKSIATAFLYGLFWCMASSVYLLLRKDVDETEMDEVFVSAETRTYQLPPLRSDADGIPQVQDPTPDVELPPEDRDPAESVED
ncbi:MAG: hypothetical protein AAFN77_05505 [Planctomycetota bacterium]